MVIELQFEPADDKHLGQIMDYIGAVNPKYVIWIAEQLHPKKTDGLNWLNNTGLLSIFVISITSKKVSNNNWVLNFHVAYKPENVQLPKNEVQTKYRTKK